MGAMLQFNSKSDEVPSTETRNVSCGHFYEETSILISSSNIRVQSGQSDPIPFENVFHGFGNGWKIAHVAISLQYGN